MWVGVGVGVIARVGMYVVMHACFPWTLCRQSHMKSNEYMRLIVKGVLGQSSTQVPSLPLIPISTSFRTLSIPYNQGAGNC